MASDEYCEECGCSPCIFQQGDTVPEKFRPKTHFIGVTAFTVGLANKQYGGPEEGGWYYDTFSPERVLYVSTLTRSRTRYFAEHCRQRLERWCNRMNEAEKRYPPSSVLCSGYWIVVQDAVTEDEPQERQYYS